MTVIKAEETEKVAFLKELRSIHEKRREQYDNAMCGHWGSPSLVLD